MKRIERFIGVLLLAGVLALACTTRPHYDPRLAQADRLLTVCPDSALRLLEVLPADSLHTEADRAYYALLLTQARDKNYLMQTNDSLIRVAVCYFDSVQDINLRARAYYLWGSICRDRNESPEAVEKYLEAAHWAKECRDRQLEGYIYNSLGYLYYREKLYNYADTAYQRVEQIGWERRDSSLWAEALARRGRICMDINQMKEGRSLLSQAMAIACDRNYTAIEAEVSSSLSMYYGRLNEGEAALHYAERYYKLKNRVTNYRGFMLLGNAYCKLGKYDSAYVYLQKSLGTRSYRIKSDTYLCLVDIAQRQDCSDQAFLYSRLHAIYRDSVHQTLQNVAVVEVINRNRLRMYKVEYSLSYVIREYGGKFTWGILLLVLMYGIWRYKKKHQVNVSSSSQEDVREEVDELECKRNALLKDAYDRSDIYAKMQRIIREHLRNGRSGAELTEEDWLQLVAETDHRWKNITLRLQEKYDLTQKEIRVCCLYLTDLPISHLQYLLRCSRDSVYRKGYDILEKKIGLSRSDISLKDFLRSF